MNEEKLSEHLYQYRYWDTHSDARLRHLEALIAYKVAHDEPIDDAVRAMQLLQTSHWGFWGQLVLRFFKRESSKGIRTDHSLIERVMGGLIGMIILVALSVGWGTTVYISFVVGFEMGQNPKLLSEVTRILENHIKP